MPNRVAIGEEDEETDLAMPSRNNQDDISRWRRRMFAEKERRQKIDE